MEFKEKARQIQSERKERMARSDSDGNLAIPINCYVEQGDTLIKIDNCLLVLSNLNEDDQTSDAQLVRAGIWKNEDCAILHLVAEEFTMPLARVNPEEEKNLSNGWITEKGEIILKGLENAIKA